MSKTGQVTKSEIPSRTTMAEFLAIAGELGINPKAMTDALCHDQEALRIIASEAADK